jgi:hypothetical protein
MMRALVVIALASGCYSPQLQPCTVTCNPGDTCPDDMTCQDDHRCHPAGDTQACPVPKHQLMVHLAGTGQGVVTGSPGINCMPDCTTTVYEGTLIMLSAMATGGSRFAGWGGACSGTDPCDVLVDSDKTVGANFNLAQPLSVMFAGVGGGEVVSDPPGLDCTSDCTVLFDQGAIVTLMAFPDSTSTFGGWFNGPCSGQSNCVVTLSAATAVTSEFD